MNSLHSYSQFREDRQIIRFFGRKWRGTFVDVGANDGLHGSNTLLLEQLGWHGFLIEPNERLAGICRATRSHSVVINKAAVGDPDIREVVLYEYYGVHHGTENYDGLSSVGFPSALHDFAVAGGATVRRISVPAATLDQILEEEQFGSTTDFVSIDVEGLELQVLQGFSLGRYSPRLLVIEDNSMGKDKRVCSYLAAHGYQHVHRTGVNNWFVREHDARAFLIHRIVLWSRMLLWKFFRTARRILPLRFSRSSQAE